MTTPHPVSHRIRAFHEGLLPEMVTIKYGALAEDLFRFFRGTNHLFYEDLAGAKPFPGSPPAWLCGDLHLENFGSYKGDNRLVYFDISDFDEGLLGPALWDVVRMTCSIYVGLAALGCSTVQADGLAHNYVHTYGSVLASGKARHIQLQTSRGIVLALLQKVSGRNVEKWLRKRVEITGDSSPAFKDIPRKQLKIEDPALRQELMTHIARIPFTRGEHEEHFSVEDVCFRVAGTGSLGIRRYLFLMKAADGEHWLLDMKQCRPSALLPYLELPQPYWPSEADRVVGIEYRMQDVPEALLTTTVFRNEAYKLQEMQPLEDKVEFHQLTEDWGSLEYVIRDMASLTASAQFRSTGRGGAAIADELIAFGRTASWQNEVLAYAQAYSQRLQAYYQQFLQDYQEGFFDS